MVARGFIKQFGVSPDPPRTLDELRDRVYKVACKDVDDHIGLNHKETPEEAKQRIKVRIYGAEDFDELIDNLDEDQMFDVHDANNLLGFPIQYVMHGKYVNHDGTTEDIWGEETWELYLDRIKKILYRNEIEDKIGKHRSRILDV